MNLEQFLAALRAGGQQATDALAQASPELLAQAVEHYNAEVERLAAADLTEDNISALEGAVAQRGQVTGQQALAARRAAAMGVDNAQPGSDAEPTITNQADDTGGTERSPRAGRGVARADHQTGDGGDLPADGQVTQTTGGPTGPGGVPEGASVAGQHAMARQRGGIAQHRADAPTSAPLERESAGTVVRTARATMSTADIEHGQVITSDSGLYEAFSERIWATCGPSGRYPDGERAGVVRITSEYPESRRLSDGSAERNDALVAAAIGDPSERTPSALVASAPAPASTGVTGGLCAPLDVRRDINVLGVTATPIENSLTGFSVPHGGIQYRAPMDMLAMDSGMGIWTMADDAAVVQLPNPGADIPEPFKHCFVAECPGTVEAILFSTYLCMEFPNILAKFDPEWVRAVTRGSLIAHARWSENQLYARMAAASKIMVGKRQLSATRDLLATLDKAVSRYRSRYRLNEDVTLHWTAPQWVINLVRTDVMRGMVTSGPGDTAWAVTQAWLEGLLRTRNVNVTWHLDGLDTVTKNGVTIPAQHYGDVSDAAGTVVAPWPTAIDSLLYVEGDWLLLDGGSMDFGVVRDSKLNARNRYRTFTERFLGVAFTGMESWRLVMPVEATGAMVGTVPPSAIDDTAGTVEEAMGLPPATTAPAA